jgi:hypothetical protein
VSIAHAAAPQRGPTALSLAEANGASYIQSMESPRSVNVFALTFVGVVLLGLLILSIYIQDFAFFFEAVGVIVLVVLGCAVGGFLLGVVTSPLVWLLSIFGARGPKPKH